MSKEIRHAALPYELRASAIGPANFYEIVGREDGYEAILACGDYENMQFIYRSCILHYELLEELKRAIQSLEFNVGNKNHKGIERAKAVIAKAEAPYV